MPRKAKPARLERVRGPREDGREYLRILYRRDMDTKPLVLGWITREEGELRLEQELARLTLDMGPSPRESLHASGPVAASVVAAYADDLSRRPVSDGYKLTTEKQASRIAERRIGLAPVESITTAVLRTYIDDRLREGVSATHAHNEAKMLRRALRWALNERRIPPMALPDLPRRASLPDDERPPRRLTEAEVTRLVQAAESSKRWRSRGIHLQLLVMAWSGRRPIAVNHARGRDCRRLLDEDLPRARRLMWWERDKGGRRRGWSPITEPAYLALRQRAEQVGPDDLLWTKFGGGRHDDISWARQFKRIAIAAGLEDVQSYDLRRFACAQLLRQLGNPRVCIEFSGHKTVSMFLTRYAFALPGSAEDQAARVGWTPEPLRLVEENGTDG